MRNRMVLTAVFCLSLTSVALAQTTEPAGQRVIRFNGTVTDAATVAAVPTAIRFAVYDQETDGRQLWEEVQILTVDAAGHYSVLLGDTSGGGLPVSLFADGARRWLGVEVAGRDQGPRVLLTAVPYAVSAATASDAKALAGRPAADYVLTPEARRRDAVEATGNPNALAAPVPQLNNGVAGFIGKFFNTLDLDNSAMFQSAGRIGLGTTSPLDALHVSFANSAGSATGYAVQNLGSTSSSYSGMLFYDHTGALRQFQGYNNGTGEYRINNISPTGSINFMIGGTSRFAVANNGSIGIGTTTPTRARLEVVGNITNQPNPGNVGFFNSNGVLANIPAGVDPISIYATADIFSPVFIAFSDARIKKIRGLSDGRDDLSTLTKLQITDYTYIDTTTFGTGTHKKVIAQQVEQVFPQAVQRNTDVLPDIYEKAHVKDGWVMLATSLKPGDRVRLIGPSTEGIHEVLEADADRFRPAAGAEGSEVFVYGREVNDFLSVDYDAIAMLNVSATQELNRQLSELRAETAALKQDLAEMRTALKAALDALARPRSTGTAP
jgi:hypothetical protein